MSTRTYNRDRLTLLPSVAEERAVLFYRLDGGGLLVSCVTNDGDSLAVLAEAVVVLGVAELVSVAVEVPGTDNTARLDFLSKVR
jgi:hypothetical protein